MVVVLFHSYCWKSFRVMKFISTAMKACFTIMFITTIVSSSLAKVIRRDTYLSAYMDSHGPEAMSPGEVYGAPAATYGAPAMGYNYGPPAEEPHAAPINPLDPIHAKIVLLFKVLLKILIFKLIVKFIAIMCVLFFLPKLTELGVAKEESRKITEKVPYDDDDLRTTRFVLDAISGGPLPRTCRTEDTAMCRMLQRVRELDSRYSVHRLFKVYLKEENGKLRKHQN